MNIQTPLPAVVIGAGIAGLLVARVLHEFFPEVIILEKDMLDEHAQPRKGVPQSYHPHVLLVKGLQSLETLFPGIEEEMLAAGALPQRSDAWHISTPKGILLPADIGYASVSATRPLIEWVVRRRVKMLPGLQIVQGQDVVGLKHDATTARITGLVMRGLQKSGERTELNTALVVDTSGRTSKAVAWLQEVGYTKPREDVVNAGIGYASCFFHVPENTRCPSKNLLIQPHPQLNPRSGLLQEVERGLWQVVLAGSAGLYPPKDNSGFLQWASQLPDPVLYRAIREAAPASPVYNFRILKTHFRHFEKLSRWPSGFIVGGDAVCAFNPIYGQGMTIAALEALALQQVLREGRKKGWEKAFQQKAAACIGNAWLMGTIEDLRWEKVTLNGSEAGFAYRLGHQFLDALLATACSNKVVSKAYLSTIAMLIPPTALLRPAIFLRVLRHALTTPGNKGRAAAE